MWGGFSAINDYSSSLTEHFTSTVYEVSEKDP